MPRGKKRILHGAVNAEIPKTVKKEDICLTEQQKEFILENWDKMGLLELVRATFKDNKLDGRSVYSAVLKQFLVQSGLNTPKTTKHIKVEPVILTEEHQEFIVKHVSNLRAIEMARVLFDNPNIQPLSKEVRAISNYIATIDDKPIFEGRKNELPDEDVYNPPAQISQVVGKVNLHTQQDIDFKNMPMALRKCMEALRAFLRAPRFLEMINSYTTKASRQIFESEFIRGVWDKPDLSSDELNLYVNLCSNYVMMITINRQLDKLNERYDAVMEDADAKLSMTLAEMIKVKTDELNKCDKRQSDLIESLNGKRSAKKNAQKSSNMSVANLIEIWKEESERKRIIEMAEMKRKSLENEVERLGDIDELKARILGYSKDDLLRG